ncbi:tRNA (guanosine(46)-N7)-methyltransferase TrmB [Hydrogenivirga sp.]
MLCLLDYKKVEKPLPWDNVLVEIGFGGGDFIVKLAKESPDRKVLGFELSGISVQKLFKRAKREGIKNLYCTRIDAYWGFYFLLKDASVAKVFMNYPDPWFKKRHFKRRLTSRENLFLFSKRLKQGGQLVIRTDYRPFTEFTLEEAEYVGGFTAHLRELRIGEPITKYEKKWLSMGKKLYELILEKVEEPKPVRIPSVKEVKELFPVKQVGSEPDLQSLEGREFRIEDNVYLKLFKHYTGGNSMLLEALLSEEGFIQKFFLQFRRKGNVWITDVSPHSEVLRTEGIQRAVELVAEKAFKP